jgi:hypothetical protein
MQDPTLRLPLPLHKVVNRVLRALLLRDVLRLPTQSEDACRFADVVADHVDHVILVPGAFHALGKAGVGRGGDSIGCIDYTQVERSAASILLSDS